ncbi:MAG: glycosyltransferase family 2 protein, partial [Alphaproteobacteria bacterium]
MFVDFPGAPENLAGWVVVKAMLGADRIHYDSVALRVFRRSAAELIVPLPVAANGRIQELVCLPDDMASLAVRLPEAQRAVSSTITITPVSSFERIWRMWDRVLGMYLALSSDDRRRYGLSLTGALFNLTRVFRLACDARMDFLPLPYADWVVRFDELSNAVVQRIHAHIGALALRPRFHVVINAGTGQAQALRATCDALTHQVYPDFEYTVAKAIPTLTVTGAQDWIMVLRAGDVLAPHALYWFAAALAEHPDAAILYADDDALDADGSRCDPRFKPDWSLVHFRATNYIGNAVAIRGDVLAATGGLDADACQHGLSAKILQVCDLINKKVVHVPAVLLHRGLQEDADNTAQVIAAWEVAALQQHLAQHGIATEVETMVPGRRRVRYRLPATPPLVSIIIPTRDGETLLRRCVDSVLGKSTYPRFEILVVDNQSTDAAALTYLRELAAHPAIRVLPYDHRFNFSAINNFAAREARGDILCLLNNDTEVITPDWLEEMVGHVLQDRVGVVGAKLYYPDGRVQHAGDTVGSGGCAAHLHAGIARDDPGYCNRAAVAQDLSAVTAACMVTRRDLYLQLGGLDARWLRVAFNDVDYCLRVRAAGWKVIWTPHAELYHHES